MKRKVLFLAGVLAAALTGFLTTTCDAGWETEDTHPLRVFERRVFELTNAERIKNGLRPLIWSDSLAAVARAHSEDMAHNGYFSHTGLDGSSPWDRLARAGIQYWNAAENICAGYSTPEAAVNAWMNSSGHRANILNGSLTHLGVGVAYLDNSRYRYYATQMFITSR